MGFIKNIWNMLKQPSQKSLGVLLVLGFVVGFLAFATIHFGANLTSTSEFCQGCHEMSWPAEEWKKSIHYQNAAGVRAGCADCHLPKGKYPADWIGKMMAKARAARDIYHHILGTYDTEQKFKAGRWEMANMVWDRMKASDSQECRNCHSYEGMNFAEQGRMAGRKHPRAMEEGKTCIDCHVGVAHAEPEEPNEPEEKG